MLHTKTDKSRKFIVIRQFTHSCVNCIGCMHASLCNNCPTFEYSTRGQKEITGEMTERITSVFEQENISRPNERNI